MKTERKKLVVKLLTEYCKEYEEITSTGDCICSRDCPFYEEQYCPLLDTRNEIQKDVDTDYYAELQAEGKIN